MKAGDLVAWAPTRGAAYPQDVKFVGIVTEVDLYSPTNGPRIRVIWNESTIPTLNDPRDVYLIEATSESR